MIKSHFKYKQAILKQDSVGKNKEEKKEQKERKKEKKTTKRSTKKQKEQKLYNPG